MQSVKILRDYSIPHVGLKLGKHEFEYLVDDQFFKAFEGATIEHCKVDIKLLLEKKETLFVLDFYVDGVVTVNCDRCAEPFEKEIFGDFQCLVKYKDERDENVENTDEIIYIFRDASYIQIADLLYDFIHLCLPMQLIHPDNKDGLSSCNPDVIKYLASSREIKPTEEEDPRWAALKKLKDNN
jgi:uncharacterized metal-binding protein YceD (DUF177 family)